MKPVATEQAPKLELKKVKLAPSLSEETNAFTGELWVNGKLAARCQNAGHGGSTDYHDTYEIPNGTELVKLAEDYCKTLPAVKVSQGESMHIHLEMDLELWIDTEVENIIEAKEADKLKKKIERRMEQNIIYGRFKENGLPIDGTYQEVSFNNGSGLNEVCLAQPFKFTTTLHRHISFKPLLWDVFLKF